MYGLFGVENILLETGLRRWLLVSKISKLLAHIGSLRTGLEFIRPLRDFSEEEIAVAIKSLFVSLAMGEVWQSGAHSSRLFIFEACGSNVIK